MSRVQFNSDVFLQTMNEEQTNQEQSKYLYNDINELVAEWQNSEKDCSFWEFLGLSETVFKTWMAKCKSGVFEN